MLKPSLDDLIKSSFRSILKNKSRTVLTSLGIIIGVTSVILLTSIGNGLKNYISNTFDSLGSNLIFIVPGRVFNDNGGFNNSGTMTVATKFSEKDVYDLKKQLKPAIVFPASEDPGKIKYNNLEKRTTLVGATEEFGKYRNMNPEMGNGRWFTNEENDKRSEVVVLGNKVAKELFGTQSPINRKVVIEGKNLKVIGVAPKKGSTMGGPDIDNHVYMPLKTASGIFGSEDIHAIQVKFDNSNDVERIKSEAKKVLMKKFKDEDAFSVFDQGQLLSSINSILNILTVALTGIAAISLVVGGIGIMNIMLVTVTERTKEIGLRKAIGAYPRAILLQFLIEAVILSGLGGFFGIVLGSLGTLAINSFFPAKVTISSVLLAFGVSSAVGIIFGVAPARKASKLSPIEALRYE